MTSSCVSKQQSLIENGVSQTSSWIFYLWIISDVNSASNTKHGDHTNALFMLPLNGKCCDDAKIKNSSWKSFEVAQNQRLVSWKKRNVNCMQSVSLSVHIVAASWFEKKTSTYLGCVGKDLALWIWVHKYCYLTQHIIEYTQPLYQDRTQHDCFH